jgi:hypothetical protein
MKRLVLMVEGDGDVLAVPALAGRLRSELPYELQQHFILDNQPFVIGSLEKFTGPRNQPKWIRYLEAARESRKNLGAMLAVVDGDSKKSEWNPFCAVTAARTLAERGRAAGAGVVFSLAVVLLRQEYESILIAAADQLPGIDPQAPRPANPEEAPRDAKGWLTDHMEGGYKEKIHQRTLTQAVQDWQPVRATHRSFRRFCDALGQLAGAVATGVHVVTPVPPVPPAPAPPASPP